nr:MAG TPA: PR zinc knuckle motif [Caudoviricetes sp.]
MLCALFRVLGASVPVRFRERGLLPVVICQDCIGVYGGTIPPHGKPQAVNNRG